MCVSPRSKQKHIATTLSSYNATDNIKPVPTSTNELRRLYDLICKWRFIRISDLLLLFPENATFSTLINKKYKKKKLNNKTQQILVR